MEYEFTSAAHRVLIRAARWSGSELAGEISAPALLLGLLIETECRAAEMLARHAVDANLVHQRWPNLQDSSEETDKPEDGYFAESPLSKLPPLSPDVKASLAAANRRMRGFECSLVFATEHILLGLVAGNHETAEWLHERGLLPKQVEEEIHQQYGHCTESLPADAEPLPYDDEIDQSFRSPPGQTEAVASQETAARSDHAPLGQPIRSDRLAGEVAGEIGLLRVLDAAANRAREALRVLEDYVRFVLDDRHLTEQFKRFRHEMTSALADVPLGRRLSARETLADVGTGVTTPSEYRRENVAGVLAANFARLQESLRSLEEYGKLLASELAVCCERLRYRAYTLQRAVEITASSAERLARIRLYVLLDGGPSTDRFAELVRTLVDAQVHALQLRDKRLDDRRLIERARILREITRPGDTLFIMNDRPDLAALSDADGVHIGQEELSVKDARSIVGPDMLIGLSTHSIEQARRAVEEGANYLGVGPTFPSGTKHFQAFPGLELIRTVAEEIRLPAFAIGGITAENLPQVLSAGLSRVAVSGAIATAPDPAAEVRRMLGILGVFPRGGG